MTIAERFKYIRKEVGYTQQRMADTLGLKQNTIATYEMGRSELSDRTIKDVCQIFNVNEQWLRTGEGEMFKPLSRDEEVAKFFGEMLMPAGDEDSFKRRFISAVARLNPEQWKMLEEVATALTEGMKKADP